MVPCWKTVPLHFTRRAMARGSLFKGWEKSQHHKPSLLATRGGLAKGQCLLEVTAGPSAQQQGQAYTLKDWSPGPRAELEGLRLVVGANYLSGIWLPPFFFLTEERPEKTRPWPQLPRAWRHWLMWAPKCRPPNAKSAQGASPTLSVPKQDAGPEESGQLPGSFATANRHRPSWWRHSAGCLRNLLNKQGSGGCSALLSRRPVAGVQEFMHAPFKIHILQHMGWKVLLPYFFEWFF